MKFLTSGQFTNKDVQKFITAYLECAMWSSHAFDDEGTAQESLDQKYEFDDIDPESMEAAQKECVSFIEGIATTLRHAIGRNRYTMAGAGHDFWLTRNHHGAGFWDRGLGAAGESLSRWAKSYGEKNLIVGDDGKLYFE